MFLLMTLILFIYPVIYGQQYYDRVFAKKLKADKSIADPINGDGVYTVRNKKTQKWGMCQVYSKKKARLIIPMQYDSIRFYPFNAFYTAVYNDGKVGFYLSEWIFGDEAKESVPCIYEDYVRINVQRDNYPVEMLDEYLAVMRNGKWGWIDYYSGEEKSDFIYNSYKELPKPEWDPVYY